MMWGWVLVLYRIDSYHSVRSVSLFMARKQETNNVDYIHQQHFDYMKRVSCRVHSTPPRNALNTPYGGKWVADAKTSTARRPLNLYPLLLQPVGVTNVL